MSKVNVVLFMLFFQLGAYAQFSEDSLSHYRVLPNDTDPFIAAFGSDYHQIFYNPTSAQKNTLLLHLVGSGDTTGSTLLYPTLAANRGFHCINLDYRNGVSGQSACADVPDTDCHLNWRKEIIEGIDYSSEIVVSQASSINNRILKLLQYLDANAPTQNWGQYFSGNTVLWDKIIVSGHSQGGGHAAVIGISQPVKRVLMFGSPNDYIDTLNMNAPWSALPHVVEDSNYFSFNALYDEIVDYSKQFNHSQALGQGAFGDTVLVDNTMYPYNSTRQLYTIQESPSGFPIELTHDIMIRDHETPINGSGEAEFACVWLYMLGVDCNEPLDIDELQLSHGPKELIGIYDLMGRPTTEKSNTVLIYVFSDGTTKKVFRVK